MDITTIQLSKETKNKIPSFGIKVDACPGRLAEANIYILSPGLYLKFSIN